jgi:hypothetical protein
MNLASAITAWKNVAPSVLGNSLLFAQINSAGGSQMISLKITVSGNNINWSAGYEIPITAHLSASSSFFGTGTKAVLVEPLREAYYMNRYQLLIENANEPNQYNLYLRKTVGTDTGTATFSFISSGAFNNNNIRTENNIGTVNIYQYYPNGSEVYVSNVTGLTDRVYADGSNDRLLITSNYTLNGTNSTVLSFRIVKQGRTVHIQLPAVSFNTNTTGSMSINFTLDTQFRPSANLNVPVTILNNGNVLAPATFTVTASGTMSITAGNYASGLGGLNSFAGACGIPNSGYVSYCIF